MYIEYIGTEFGTLQIRRHIRSVEISEFEITSVDCTTKDDISKIRITEMLVQVSFDISISSLGNSKTICSKREREIEQTTTKNTITKCIYFSV